MNVKQLKLYYDTMNTVLIEKVPMAYVFQAKSNLLVKFL